MWHEWPSRGRASQRAPATGCCQQLRVPGGGTWDHYGLSLTKCTGRDLSHPSSGGQNTKFTRGIDSRPDFTRGCPRAVVRVQNQSCHHARVARSFYHRRRRVPSEPVLKNRWLPFVSGSCPSSLGDSGFLLQTQSRCFLKRRDTWGQNRGPEHGHSGVVCRTDKPRVPGNCTHMLISSVFTKCTLNACLQTPSRAPSMWI